MADKAEALRQLQRLRDVYAASLGERIAQLEATWGGLETNWNPETLSALTRLAHNLAGSGSSFGFCDLSHAAHELEHYLGQFAGGAAPDSARKTQVSVLLDCVRVGASQPDGRMAPQTPEFLKIPPGSLTTSDPAPQTSGSTPAVRQSKRKKPANGDHGALVGPDAQTDAVGLDSPLLFIVDDDIEMARDLALQIGFFGYRVHTYETLDALRQALRKTRPAVLLMDVMFAEGAHAGPQTVAEIKRETNGSLPVLFISAQGDLLSRLHAVRADADGYFTKPVQIGVITDRLDALTARRAPEPYRILVVDDDPTLAGFYAATLEHAGMISRVVTDPLQVMAHLPEFQPDLILMDVYMPDCTGMELAAVLRQQQNYTSIPIVFLSAETDMDKQLTAMSLGGDEFLTKPIQSEHLVSAVESRSHRSRTLRALMTRDSLTGLLNHTAIKERLELEIGRLRRYHGGNTALAYAMIDIDRFKSINDTYGHAAGDLVIKSLARVLEQRLRRTDEIGRYGGEEFAIILPETDGPKAARVLDEIRANFARVRQQAGSAEFNVTFSCGVASLNGLPHASDLSDRADKAMYRAKQGGRNRVVLAG